MIEKRMLRKLPLKGTKKVLEVELSYSKGGMNYFTGDVRPRGLYLSVTPIERSNGFSSFTAFEGITHCVAELKRYSEKTLFGFEPDETIIKKMIDHVLVKQNYTLA